MQKRQSKFIGFVKREAVLCIATLLAVLSVCLVPPDRCYAEYIDVRTLAILFCLMCVMAGLQKMGVFRWIAGGLLRKVTNSVSLILVLMLLCFFSSMLITNDVALITFVPFTFTVLEMMGKDIRYGMSLPLVAMQTVAANLGSMLTPIGNPQNLYLYGKAGLSLWQFILLMLPYAVLSLILLLVWGIFMGRKYTDEGQSDALNFDNRESIDLSSKMEMFRLFAYLTLFLICLLVVAHVMPWQAALAAVLAVVLFIDRTILVKVDYSLLLTFVGFFVFIGNVGRIPVFRELLQRAVSGREVCAAVITSQFISNVPAALLLSGFTENYGDLLIGVNIGGMGTLIASMASLISYKYVAKEENQRKGRYLIIFTMGCICFLAALLLLHMVWTKLRCM